MAKVSVELKNKLKELSKEELLKIINKFANKHKDISDILEHDYVHSETNDELYEDLKDDLEFEMSNISYGRVIQKSLAKSISYCIKEINSFKRTTKSSYHEALALQFLLNLILDNYSNELETCWTIFDSKVVSTSKRYFNAVLYLHEDYHIEFINDFEKILKMVKNKCGHFDSIYCLPKSFDEMKLKKISK
ncbi:MAG: hypothetical protein A2X08_16940 [Bacteroidetes bacterium GWA2_32_17]|nr:MAG: hypothetical protein A2X08_16940 [Bacteroidetes bacterium GWA2_32_17]